MTKPLPTGCIKQNFDTSWRTLNLLFQNVRLDDHTGHLYVVDIEFDHTKATEEQLFYKVYPPIIEKQKNYWSMWKVGILVAWTIFLKEQLKKLMQHHSKKKFNQCI